MKLSKEMSRYIITKDLLCCYSKKEIAFLNFTLLCLEIMDPFSKIPLLNLKKIFVALYKKDVKEQVITIVSKFFKLFDMLYNFFTKYKLLVRGLFLV